MRSIGHPKRICFLLFDRPGEVRCHSAAQLLNKVFVGKLAQYLSDGPGYLIRMFDDLFTVIN